MRILSLFDGISCGRLALERAGIPVEVYYASEIDKYAIKVSEKNYPCIIRLGDVREIDFSRFIGKIEEVRAKTSLSPKRTDKAWRAKNPACFGSLSRR